MELRTSAVDIGRPATAVCAVVFDFTNDPQWRTEVMKSSCVQRSAGEVGARYEQTLQVAGRQVETSFTVTELVPDALVGFAGTSGPLRIEGSLVLVALDSDRTRLYFSHHMAGPMWFRVVGRWLARRRRRGIERDLDQLRRLLEAG